MRIGWSIIGTTRSSATSMSLKTSTPVLDAHAVEHGDEHLERRVAGAGAEARQPSRRCGARPPRSRRASSRSPSPGCDGRGSRSRSRAASSARSSADPRRDVVGQHVAGRVGAVDAVARRSSPSASPARGAASGVDHVRHHQEARPCRARACATARCAARRRRPRCSAWRRGWCATPQSVAMCRWSTVPMPGSSSAETFALLQPRDDARAGTPRRCASGKP